MQVKSKCQPFTHMPLWNEVLEIAVPSFPSTLVMKLISCFGCESSRTVATFELEITSELSRSFCNEWLCGRFEKSNGHSKIEATNSGSETSESICSSQRPPRLHVACSMNRDFVEACRRGLWPICRSLGHRDLLSLAERTVLSKRVESDTAFKPVQSIQPTDLTGIASRPLLGGEAAARPHTAASYRENADECGRRRSRSPPGRLADAASRTAIAPAATARPSSQWREQQASFRNLSESPTAAAAARPHPRRAEALEEEAAAAAEDEWMIRSRPRASGSPGRSVSPLDRVLFRPAADRPEVLVGGGDGGGGFGPRGKRKPQSEM